MFQTVPAVKVGSAAEIVERERERDRETDRQTDREDR